MNHIKIFLFIASLVINGCASVPEVKEAPMAAPTPAPAATPIPAVNLAVKLIAGCPEGFVLVAKNEKFGIANDFCVMKFEAKQSGQNTAISQPANIPWTNINQSSAKTQCTNLGAGYDLMTNAEWMTIATEIEKVPSNWSGGVVGSGYIYRGHSDGVPDSGLDITDLNDVGGPQKRNHQLARGGEIWDFAGNVWEWVNWTASPAIVAGPASCIQVWQELYEMSCTQLKPTEYLPGNPGGLDAAFYGAVYGMGKFQGGAGGGATRGGYWGDKGKAGIFALSMFFDGSKRYFAVGFRCVYHP